jgi:hypothetical protein
MDEEQSKPREEELEDNKPKTEGRRSFLTRMFKLTGGVVATAAGSAAFINAITPKEIGEERSTIRHELKLGDSIEPVAIIADEQTSLFNIPETRLITTQDEYRAMVDKILEGNKDFAQDYPESPLAHGFDFDPERYIGVLYAIGEKPSSLYKAKISGAKLGKGQIEIELENRVPPVDHLGNVIQPESTSGGTTQSYQFEIFPKVKDQKGNPLPYIFKTPVVIPGEAAYSKTNSSQTTLNG